MLGVPAQGSGTGKLSSFAGWRAGGHHRRAVGSLDFACELWACASLLLKQDGEGRLKTVEMAAAFPPLPYHMPRPEPSEHASPVYYLLMMKCQKQQRNKVCTDCLGHKAEIARQLRAPVLILLHLRLYLIFSFAVMCTWLFARCAIYNTADSSEIHPKKRPISMKMSSKEKHGRFILQKYST